MVIIIKSFGCQGDEWITVELQDPFCDWAVVKIMEAVFAFAKIHWVAIYTTYISVAPVEPRTLATAAIALESFQLL